MKPQLFTEKKTGRLLPISVHDGSERDFAFVPHALTSNWRFPDRLWPKLTEAHRAVARLDGIGRTLPDPQLLLAPLSHREALASSKLEGTYATAQELMLFELSPRDPKSDGDEVNSWLEVANYAEALRVGTSRLHKASFDRTSVKELHRILVTGVRGMNANPGEFRKHQVAIGSDRRFIPPPPEEIDGCIADLESYVNLQDIEMDPLIRAYLVHYQFEAIHPFADGNGRIGRVLLSLIIAKWCDLKMPWLYLSPFFDQFKDEYIRNMFQVSTEGAWEAWLDFCLTGTIRQAKDAIRRCEQLNSLKETMPSRLENQTVRTQKIINSLFSNPFVRIGSLSRILNVSYPTAKDDVQRLVDADILRPLESMSPKAYYSPEIFRVAYREDQL